MTNKLRYFSEVKDDFLGKLEGLDGGWTDTSSGTAAAASLLATPVAGHPGIAVVDCGTDTNGSSFLVDSITDFYVDGSKYEFEGLFRIPVLSVALDEYDAVFGFGDTATTHDQANGIYFYYDRVNDGVNLFAATAQNSVATEVNTGFAVPANTWFRLKIAFTGTKAFFFVNDVEVAGISTTLPNTTSYLFGRLFGLVKSAGTTATVIQCDSFSIRITPATNR